MPLLEVRDLSITLGEGPTAVAAVNGVDLDLDRGEVIGIVGESGAGKTMLSRAIAGILPESATASGLVRFDGQDVLAMEPEQLERHHGSGVAFCFQQPRRALNPVRRAGAQLGDRLRAHQPEAIDVDERSMDLFQAVGIRDARGRLRAFPHELSGGMVQRVMISLALGCSPSLLVADEPTTGLDVTLTRSVLRLLRNAAIDHDRALVVVSHDLAAIAEVCDRIVVMYAGTIVEEGRLDEVLARPSHPYTISLLAAAPDISGDPITVTPGAMPALHAAPTSCPFAPRCPIARERCSAERPTLSGPGERRVACFFAEESDRATRSAGVLYRGDRRSIAVDDLAADESFVEAIDLEVTYGERFRQEGFKAIRGVSLSVGSGQTLGIVGESGCGKSTLGRAIVGLLRPSSGTVRVGGVDVSALRGRALRRHRRHMQMVFQDPIDALNPRRTVEETLRDSAKLIRLPATEVERRIDEALADVGLDPIIRRRRRHELSGGQAQRVGIARALIVDPRLIVFDEPTSALDVTVQAQVLAVMAAVMERSDRSYILISHDLPVIRGMCDSIAVLYLGRVVEQGPVDRVFNRPLHPYTQALLGSVSSLRRGQVPGVQLKQDLEAAEVPRGCPLTPRCPFALERCHSEPQDLKAIEPAHAVACWRAPTLSASTAGRSMRDDGILS